MECRELTGKVKEIASKVGADLVGVVSSETADAIPRHWVGWKIQSYTTKTTEIMRNAKSVVMLGYHVWDDIFEVAVRKGDRWVYPGYTPLTIQSREIGFFLRRKGKEAIASPSFLPLKKMAQLAGFGAFGKNSLIISPELGPWVRLTAILTDAELIPDEPFEGDLCGDCEECVEACPTRALTPYRVDPDKCLVGIHLIRDSFPEYQEAISRFEPSLTENSHLMCMECQKACKFSRRKHGEPRSIT